MCRRHVIHIFTCDDSCVFICLLYMYIYFYHQQIDLTFNGYEHISLIEDEVVAATAYINIYVLTEYYFIQESKRASEWVNCCCRGGSELKSRVYDLNGVNLPLYCYRISVSLFVRLFCTRSNSNTHTYTVWALETHKQMNMFVYFSLLYDRIYIEQSYTNKTSFLNLKGNCYRKSTHHHTIIIIIILVRMKGDVIRSHNKECDCVSVCLAINHLITLKSILTEE